ncbi:hypothetical protein [Mesorhizobium sp. A623]
MAASILLADTSLNPENVKAGRSRAVKSFLAGDRTPMWFTVAALMAGAAGTYFIAPQVNAQFEAQKIKTDFVIRNYNDLRTKMEDFQGLYTVVVQKQAAGMEVQQDVFKLQEIVARVSAQNLSLLPMFTVANGPKASAELNGAMNGMLGVISSPMRARTSPPRKRPRPITSK